MAVRMLSDMEGDPHSHAPISWIAIFNDFARVTRMQPPDTSAVTPEGDTSFNTTRWSLVIRAREAGPDARRALSELCSLYWYPLYAFVRRNGYSQDDAEDLTQTFFAQLLEKCLVGAAKREKGRFR